MPVWSGYTHILQHSWDEVVSVFWERYPNSHAKHVISEDVLERRITDNTIQTKKLIVKEGSSIMRRVPRWLSRMTDVQTMPVLEESIYDRRTRTLTTYTRNVSHGELLQMHERCIYRPTSSHDSELPSWNLTATEILRNVYIQVNCGKLSSIYEKIIGLTFKKSISNTIKGLSEKLEEKYGLVRGQRVAGAQLLKGKILKTTNIVNELKCDASGNAQ